MTAMKTMSDGDNGMYELHKGVVHAMTTQMLLATVTMVMTMTTTIAMTTTSNVTKV